MPDRSLLVLDTHVWVWSVESIPGKLNKKSLTAIEKAAQEGRLRVSAISSWELGMLTAKHRLTLSRDLSSWIEASQRPPGVRISSINSAVGVDAANLPEFVHGDPADRLIIATARALSGVLVTCDEKILEYQKLGYVRTLDARP